MRIVTLVMFAAACSSVQSPAGGQPGQPDGPTSDGPGGGSGSGSGSDPLADYRSGTRIKMQVLTTPDGAKQFQGWFDTQRNEPCTFRTASDGATRCLPNSAGFIIDGNGPYADAACTQPALQFPAGASCPTLKYMLVSPSGACPSSGPRVYLVKQTSSMFTKAGTTCTATAIPTGSVLYGVDGPEIPPTEFQSATLAVE